MDPQIRLVLFVAIAASVVVGALSKSAIQEDRLHAVANSYFRMGQQAALMARDISERKQREVRIRNGYGSRGAEAESYTNREDFEIVTEWVNYIDHPRIWEIFRKLNDGSVLGLDTNGNWSEKKWTVLKD
jgi:hypothetical protein